MSTKSELSARAQAILDELIYPEIGPDDLTVEIVQQAHAAKGRSIGYSLAMRLLVARERSGELTRFYAIGQHQRRVIAFRVTGKGGAGKRS